jgi:tetratricopeptide (TPR) repeat protein
MKTMRLRRSILSVLLIGMLCGPLSAQSLREPQFMARVYPAFDHIFNLDYAAAEETFQALGQQYPDHPAPPLYLGAVIWLRELMLRQDLNLDRFASPSYFTNPPAQPMSGEQRKLFFDLLDRSEMLAKKILAKKPGDKDAEYFLGSGYAIRGSFIFTIDRSMKTAFGFAKRAYQIDHKLIKSDPAYYDAYMGVGLYEYMMGSLPWFYRMVLSIFGFQGSKEKGFEYLKFAAEKGQYVARESEVVLMVMLVREQRNAEALSAAQSLRREFPRNFLFALNVAQILERTGRKQEALAAYLEVLRSAEEKKPNYGELSMPLFRYNLGEKLLGLGRADLAEEQFRKAIADRQTPARERNLSQMRLEEILDKKKK